MVARLHLLIWSALAAVGICWCEDSSAATTKKAVKGQQPTAVKTRPASVTVQKGKNKKGNQTPVVVATILQELHQAKRLLDLGLHDYQGHRAKADHEINRAIHILHHHHHKGKSTLAKQLAKAQYVVTHTGPISPQMQQASDQKLRQAAAIIQNASVQMVQFQTQLSPQQQQHLQQAFPYLQAATTQIQAALSIVKHYNKHHKAATTTP